MGMTYKGVEYHYAFEFKVPHENGYDRHPFRIVISDYREKNQDFSGLCLDNEIKAISVQPPFQPLPSAGFFDIISQIIDITTQSEKVYAEKYPGKTYTPFMKVEDPVFLRQFEECRRFKKSLEWYVWLKKYFEEPENAPVNMEKEITKTDVLDAQNLWFFSEEIRSKNLQISDVDYFRIGKELWVNG